MRVLILGGDGYLGWPTAMALAAKGHQESERDRHRSHGDQLVQREFASREFLGHAPLPSASYL